MDGGIFTDDWKLEKRFGNWGCYVNQKTGRPIVLQMLIEPDNDHGWAYKSVTSDMGPYDINIQAAKWLKPRLEKWVEENPDKSKDVPGYEWEWIEKCLGKAAATKSKKDIAASLVKGDKVKLIDTVANGAVVTFIDMISPSKMRILHNGREMSCKTSYIDRKVDAPAESKKSEDASDMQRVDYYADKRFFEPEEFVKYVRIAYGKDGGYVSVDSVVPVDILNKANRLAQKNGYKKLERKVSEDSKWVLELPSKRSVDSESAVLREKGIPFKVSGTAIFIKPSAEYDDVLKKLYGSLIEMNDTSESKKSESLTLKQKELKNMARYGEATDITTISDAEAKELKKKGIETVGISRGAYGMNGALLRDNEGNKYVITARSSNLFYFV